MGDVADFIFGSDEDARQVGNAPAMLPIQKRNLINLNQILDQNMGRGVNSYTGEYTAGVSGLQQQSFDLVNQLLGGGGVYGTGQDALTDLLQPFDSSSSRNYWESAIKDPMMLAWEDEILPQIQEHYIAQNAGSSGAANRAIAESGRHLAGDLAGTLAKTIFSAQQSHMGRQSQVLPQALNFARMPIETGLAAGDTQRGITQEQLMEQLQKWTYEQPYNNPWFQQYAPFALGSQAFQPILQGPTQTTGALDEISRFISAIRG